MRSATTRARQVSFNLPRVLVDDRDAFVHIPGHGPSGRPIVAVVKARVR